MPKSGKHGCSPQKVVISKSSFPVTQLKNGVLCEGRSTIELLTGTMSAMVGQWHIIRNCKLRSWWTKVYICSKKWGKLSERLSSTQELFFSQTLSNVSRFSGRQCHCGKKKNHIWGVKFIINIKYCSKKLQERWITYFTHCSCVLYLSPVVFHVCVLLVLKRRCRPVRTNCPSNISYYSMHRCCRVYVLL